MDEGCPKCGGELTEKKKDKFECQNCGTKFADLKAARKYYKKHPEPKEGQRLIPCKECEAEISPKAKACPKCGYTKSKSVGSIIIGLLCLVAAFISMVFALGQLALFDIAGMMVFFVIGIVFGIVAIIVLVKG